MELQLRLWGGKPSKFLYIHIFKKSLKISEHWSRNLCMCVKLHKDNFKKQLEEK